MEFGEEEQLGFSKNNCIDNLIIELDATRVEEELFRFSKNVISYTKQILKFGEEELFRFSKNNCIDNLIVELNAFIFVYGDPYTDNSMILRLIIIQNAVLEPYLDGPEKERSQLFRTMAKIFTVHAFDIPVYIMINIDISRVFGNKRSI